MKKKKEKSKLYTIKQNDYKSVTEVRINVVWLNFGLWELDRAESVSVLDEENE